MHTNYAFIRVKGPVFGPSKMAASRNADVTKKYTYGGGSFPLPSFCCVEGINLSFWTAAGRTYHKVQNVASLSLKSFGPNFCVMQPKIYFF